jgi:RNA polymerase sigma-70 factor (ECF subfamily)
LIIGAWLSLVERTVRDREVGGSNPLAPTINKRRRSPFWRSFFLLSAKQPKFENAPIRPSLPIETASKSKNKLTSLLIIGRRRRFMFVNDDPKENNVTLTAANKLVTGDLIGPAESRQTVSQIAEPMGLEVLFRNHYKGMFRVAYRITGSETDAEDVLQNVFLRLAPNWETRDLSPNPRAYVYRAAINASLDLVRSRARANSVSLDVIDFEQSSKHSVRSPEANFADTELRELIRQAVAKLEGRAAAAFALRYFEGYDNRQIAETLGTSTMVVAVTLHRARTRLRKEIGNYLEKHHEAQ